MRDMPGDDDVIESIGCRSFFERADLLGRAADDNEAEGWALAGCGEDDVYAPAFVQTAGIAHQEVLQRELQLLSQLPARAAVGIT